MPTSASKRRIGEVLDDFEGIIDNLLLQTYDVEPEVRTEIERKVAVMREVYDLAWRYGDLCDEL